MADHSEELAAQYREYLMGLGKRSRRQYDTKGVNTKAASLAKIPAGLLRCGFTENPMSSNGTSAALGFLSRADAGARPLRKKSRPTFDRTIGKVVLH